MFRRRTSSPGKIHYRINIDKSMSSSLRAYPSGLPPATSLGIYLYYGIIDR